MSSNKTWVNDTPTNQLCIDDRGLQFGDGLFETIAIHQGTACYLGRHMRRLQQGCRLLAIDVVDFARLAETIQRHAATHDRAVIKLILTAGNTARGYRRTNDTRPNIVIKISALPEDVKGLNIKARVCHTRLARQPRLAGIKHLNRLEQVLARHEWEDDSIHEGLLLDTDDWLIEATMSNCFMIRGKRITTPDLTNCGVAGVMRSVVIDTARTAGFNVKTTRISIDDLETADEVFLTNSLYGIRPVCEIIGTGQYASGPVTQMLQQKIADHATQDTSDNWYPT